MYPGLFEFVTKLWNVIAETHENNGNQINKAYRIGTLRQFAKAAYVNQVLRAINIYTKENISRGNITGVVWLRYLA